MDREIFQQGEYLTREESKMSTKSWCQIDPKFVKEMKGALLKGFAETSDNLRSNRKAILAEVRSTDRRINSSDPVDMTGPMVTNRTWTLGKYADKHTKALQKIKDGTYGICEGECEELISKERLRARPAAEMCVECKNLHDNPSHINQNGSRVKIDPVNSVIHI